MTEEERKRRASQYSMKWQSLNPDRANAYNNAYYHRKKNDPEVRRKVKNSRLMLRYGITLAQWQQMWDDQGGRCAICREPMDGDKNAHVDHDHATGAVRELLCRKCNHRVGIFESDLREAIEAYLSRHQAQNSKVSFSRGETSQFSPVTC